MKYLTIEIKKETISKTKFKKMKKLMFSAVALVAFSFAGMANNEVKEVEVKETKLLKLPPEYLEIGDPCLPAFINTFNANYEQYGGDMAQAMAAAAWRACDDALNP